MKNLMALVVAFSLAVGLAMATPKVQDDGTYIDNFGPKDSSYAQTDLLDFDEEPASSGSDNGWILYAGIAVVLIAGVVVVMKKKKK